MLGEMNRGSMRGRRFPGSHLSLELTQVAFMPSFISYQWGCCYRPWAFLRSFVEVETKIHCPHQDHLFIVFRFLQRLKKYLSTAMCNKEMFVTLWGCWARRVTTLFWNTVGYYYYKKDLLSNCIRNLGFLQHGPLALKTVVSLPGN